LALEEEEAFFRGRKEAVIAVSAEVGTGTDALKDRIREMGGGPADG
jgi:hypothetical protein